MDRLERLINLVAALLAAERPLSRQDLRVRVGGYSEDDEAFRRNFERDKDLLRQMGVPLMVEPLDPSQPDVGDGYRILPEHYALKDPGLAEDELAALRLAASAVAMQGGDDAAATALRKLAGVPGSGPDGGPVAPGAGTGTGTVAGGQASSAAAAVSGALALLPTDETVAVLFSAVADRCRITFGYRGEPREVDPWRLSFRNGQWYLLGFDHGRDDRRLFRVDRIEGPPRSVSERGAFARPEDATVELPPAWQLGDDEELTATVLVDADQAELAVVSAGPDAGVEMRPDGSVLLTLRVTNRDGFRSFVLGYLDHAEVVAPAALRQELMAWLEVIETGSAA